MYKATRDCTLCTLPRTHVHKQRTSSGVLYEHKDKQIFSVCWTAEVIGGDGIYDCIRYVDILEHPPPSVPNPYVYLY